jgi:hypothetical protein
MSLISSTPYEKKELLIPMAGKIKYYGDMISYRSGNVLINGDSASFEGDVINNEYLADKFPEVVDGAVDANNDEDVGTVGLPPLEDVDESAQLTGVPVPTPEPPSWGLGHTIRADQDSGHDAAVADEEKNSTHRGGTTIGPIEMDATASYSHVSLARVTYETKHGRQRHGGS